jgi:hypothetical protein
VVVADVSRRSLFEDVAVASGVSGAIEEGCGEEAVSM